MTGHGVELADLSTVRQLADLAQVLRQLRRRHARRTRDRELSYRDLATRTGYAHGAIGAYFDGKALPPTDRFDVIVRLLGADDTELGALATARDQVEEARRGRPGRRPLEVPRELPPAVVAFTGRVGELAALDALAERAGSHETVIAVIAGTGGVGKTALAVHWAHRVADRFPDGQLYVDLRGYGSTAPVRPEEALAGFLRALGVSEAELPSGLAERAARFRSLVADRRILLVLDNAATGDQVRPLLPGSSSCCVLVTSRDDLTGLVGRDGARRMALDLLPAGDSMALLHMLVGARVHDDPGAAGELVERCAYLPLALRLGAEVAVARPRATLRTLVDELATGDVLAVLDAGGDSTADLSEVFSWSYRQLSTDAAQVFQRLGLHPGTQFEPHAAAALAGIDPADARRELRRLARAHLLSEVADSRYVMHDLLRAYARRCADRDSATERTAAFVRLLDWYRDTAAVAVDLVYPGGEYVRSGTWPRVSGPVVETAPQAVAWLDAENDNLLAAAEAASDDHPRHVVDLSEILYRHLNARCVLTEQFRLNALALDAARRLGDLAAESIALSAAGDYYQDMGRYTEAMDHLRRAVAVGQESGMPAVVGRGYNSLGVVCRSRGAFTEAIEHYRAALAIARDIGHQSMEYVVLSNMARALLSLGQYDKAIALLRTAVSLAEKSGDRLDTCYAGGNLGHAELLAGRYESAEVILRNSLAISREFADRFAEGNLLGMLGRLAAATGRITDAIELLNQAVEISREIGDREFEATALNALGASHRAATEHDLAGQLHQAALEVAAEIGNPLQEGKAHEGLGAVRDAAGDLAEAGEHWRTALDIYTTLDVPEADAVRRLLAGLAASPR